MRHILLAKSITAVSLAMLEAAFSALLIAATGFPHRRRASSFGTAAGAVNLAPVAGGADGDLHPAAVAGEHSAGDFHGCFPSRQRDIDRAWQYVEYSPCTRAQHGVGRGIGVNLVVLAGVVPVPFGGIFLPQLEHSCHPPRCGQRLIWYQPSTTTGARQRACFQSPYGLFPTRPLPHHSCPSRSKTPNCLSDKTS